MLSDSARKIADDAKTKGLWLYDPSYKRWYSPEDFKHIYTYANARDEFIAQLQLRHPKEGIAAGFQRLKDLQEKLEVFSKVVVDYYNKDTKA